MLAACLRISSIVARVPDGVFPSKKASAARRSGSTFSFDASDRSDDEPDSDPGTPRGFPRRPRDGNPDRRSPTSLSHRAVTSRAAAVRIPASSALSLASRSAAASNARADRSRSAVSCNSPFPSEFVGEGLEQRILREA